MGNRPDKLLAEWFWTDRWMGSSAFLLPIEPRGLYREMLTQAWRRRGRLPKDHEAIRRAVGCTKPEWNRCWPLISAYWREDGDSYVNDTQLVVLAAAMGAAEKASERGRKGAQARAQALAQALAQAKPEIQPEQSLRYQPPSPSPSPNVLPHKPAGEPSAPPKTAPERAGAFCEWYGLTHERLLRVGYIGNPRTDYETALRLVEKFSDAELQDAALVWFGMTDKFATDGTRTIAKFASRATHCVQTARKVGA